MRHSLAQDERVAPGELTRGEPLGAAGELARVYGERLSSRELEIGYMLLSGVPTHDIADRMFITVNTVKTHLKSIYRKTESLNRNDLFRKLAQYALTTDHVPQPAPRDPVTGVFDRKAFEHLLVAEQVACRLAERPLAAIAVTFEAESCAALQQSAVITVAGVIASTLRRSDIVVRWGPCAFVALLPGSDTAAAVQVVDRVVRQIHAWALQVGRRVTLWAAAAGTDEEPEGDLVVRLHSRLDRSP